MKKDWLEKYIFENKEDFDIHKVPNDMWNRIERNLGKPKKSKTISLSWVNIAASFFVILVAGILIGKIYFSNPLYRIDPDFASSIEKAELKYSMEVNNRIEIAKQRNIFNESAENHLKHLDKVYEELKQEIINRPGVGNDKIMSEMIKNYQLRIDLLENLIKRSKAIEKPINNNFKTDTI